MLKKILKKLPSLMPAIRLLPWALLWALPLMYVFIGLVHMYNEVNALSWQVYLTGYIFGIIGFYVTRGTAWGIKRFLAPDEEA
ncbi:MAG: hypothetical protein D6722_14675 [Bacteroidetes bacterium]|nr:MAG: hypothetical protein D6722_14675 [Bacteroidota bacterium]